MRLGRSYNLHKTTAEMDTKSAKKGVIFDSILQEVLKSTKNSPKGQGMILE